MERMIETGAGRSWVAMAWRFVGGDLSVTVTGGEMPHIGAAALAFWQDGAVTAAVLAAPGHKEGELARACAESLCRATGRTTLVSCGIHIDGAEPREIELLCGHVERLECQLREILLEGGPASANA